MAGQFVWFDLNTTDVQGAISFYSQVVGWTVEVWDGAGFPYPMLKPANGAPIGGVNELDKGARAMGAPSHWLGHLTVDNVEAAVAKITAAGGRALTPVSEVPTVGRMATVQDPWGAVFSAFQPTGDPMPPAAPGAMGVMCWAELMTDDIDKALAFYGDLAGWTKGGEFDIAHGKYVFMRYAGSEDGFGGVMLKPPGLPFGAWIYYFSVPDLEAAVATAQRLGGNLVVPIMDVPGGRIAMMDDPQGAGFALWASAPTPAS